MTGPPPDSGYIELDLSPDVTLYTERALDWLEATIPGYEARPAQIETVLIEAIAQMNAEVIYQVSSVAPEIFAELGTWLFNIPRREASFATGTVTISFEADADTTAWVPAGTEMAAPNMAGDTTLIATAEDAFRPDVAPFNVTVAANAANPGIEGNAPGGNLADVVDVVDGVAQIEVNGLAGGAEDETADEYRDRLAQAVTLLAPRPILPDDFATMAFQVPGVGRAMAVDLYQPDANQAATVANDPSTVGVTAAPLAPAGVPGTNVPRCVTVVIAGPDGSEPSPALRQQVLDFIDPRREVNFLVYVASPTYTTVMVKLNVVGYPSYTAEDIKANAEASLTAWLDPGTWGQNEGGDFTGGWVNEKTVRVYEAIEWANRAAGVRYVDNNSVQISINGGSTWSTTDVVLPGAFPAPRPGAMAVAVTIP